MKGKAIDYLGLCKIKVVFLMLLCAFVGMVLATKSSMDWFLVFFGCMGIGFCSASGAALNHVIDRHFDVKMTRTSNRPLPKEKITVKSAVIFAIVIGLIGVLILYFLVNSLAAWLTLATLLGYGVFYTGFLKPRTPQNIVIGGFTGALPPLLGWVCIEPVLGPNPWLLVLIVFAWTPPHFWALAIAKIDDYQKSKLPMLPVTHGVYYTKLNITFYSWLMVASTLLPYCIGMFGWFYLLSCCLLNLKFLYMVYDLNKNNSKQMAYQLFVYSIWYLMILFVCMIIDHIWII